MAKRSFVCYVFAPNYRKQATNKAGGEAPVDVSMVQDSAFNNGCIAQEKFSTLLLFPALSILAAYWKPLYGENFLRHVRYSLIGH